MAAFERDPLPDGILVLVGGHSSRVFGRRSALRERPRVVEVGRVSDPELRALLEAAQATICPSLYEGFGLAPLEAMACGCPVVASAIPPHQEVLGDAALFFDPSNSTALVSQLQRIWASEELRRALGERGRRQASRFSWLGAAQRIVELLCRLSRSE